MEYWGGDHSYRASRRMEVGTRVLTAVRTANAVG